MERDDGGVSCFSSDPLEAVPPLLLGYGRWVELVWRLSCDFVKGIGAAAGACEWRVATGNFR